MNQEVPRMKFVSTGVLLYLLVGENGSVSGQGCSNTCPPINFGTPVPALCEGDLAESFVDILEKTYSVCHPANTATPGFRLQDFKGPGRVTVLANYYTGCNAGRRESGVFAHVAQDFYNRYGDRTVFIQSVKGGGTCGQWAGLYQRDASQLFPNSGVVPTEMPLSVDDVQYELRDDWFTTPFGHPSYVVLDGDLRVRHKFIGPCCGYENYYECTADIAVTLATQLSEYIETLLAESDFIPPADDSGNDSGGQGDVSSADCVLGEFSEWSPCSVSCGSTSGTEFRWRSVVGSSCPSPVETRTCTPVEFCGNEEDICIPEFGNSWTMTEVASGFTSPRDVAFHPSPGLALGNYSEGRIFYYDDNDQTVEEAWVINGGNHSISIISGINTNMQTTLSRTDRGYYHYLNNGTAISFNHVQSGRSPDRDSFGYWAVCNDNLNTYLGTKEPNYFMGPTLYNSNPKNRNTVNRLGEDCQPDEPCYFLHADMLHESPACIGITHDPETVTAWGNVYWVFDSTGNRENGQLVRFDFQQPHGPGSMDHAVAAVRRYVEVKLERGPPGVHAGMVVEPKRRLLFVAVPGANKVIAVGADSGTYARSAREEYPIYSSRLPSFEYSIWQCVDQKDFATGIDLPTGVALSPDGDRLFVAEGATGRILVFEIDTGALLSSIETGFQTIRGLSFSPRTGRLHFVDERTNSLQSIVPSMDCSSSSTPSRVDPGYLDAVAQARASLGGEFSLLRDYECEVDPVIPNATLFDQVHDDSGYADADPDVQAMAGMDDTAYLLANRTDCGPRSELNFDALLLGGFFCHQCLPEQDKTCDLGGVCTNVQWTGYYCDNEYVVLEQEDGQFMLQTPIGTSIEPGRMLLKYGTTHRFTVREGITACLLSSENETIALDGNPSGCASNGPLLVHADNSLPSKVAIHVNDQLAFVIRIADPPVEPESGLTGGAIAGIVIGSLVVIAIVLVVAWKRSEGESSKLGTLKHSQKTFPLESGSDDQPST